MQAGQITKSKIEILKTESRNLKPNAEMLTR
jgi:hypothetical protein